MTDVILFSAVVATSLDRWSKLLIAGAILFPVVTGATVLALVAMSAFTEAKRQPTDPGVALVVDLAGQLRAGGSLRAILAGGLFGDSAASLARSGGPLGRLGGASLAVFGRDADLVAATLQIAASGGGPVAASFETLAAGMVDAARTRRERRAAMAPAIAQAVIVGGAPVLVLVQMGVSGTLVSLIAAGGPTATLVLSGMAMLSAGVVSVVLLVKRART